MDIIQQIQQLVQTRALYPMVALLLTFSMQIARKSRYSGPLLRKIPDGWRWATPVLAGGIVGFVSGYQKGYQLTGALLEALAGLFGVSFTSMGVAAALKESVIPWDGGPGGAPLPAPASKSAQDP